MNIKPIRLFIAFIFILVVLSSCVNNETKKQKKPIVEINTNEKMLVIDGINEVVKLAYIDEYTNLFSVKLKNVKNLLFTSNIESITFTSLTIEDCEDIDLTRLVNKTKGLKYLHIYNSKNINITTNPLTELQGIDIRNTKIESIIKTILPSQYIKTMIFSEVDLTNMSDFIWRFKNLEKLIIHNCLIANIPNEISACNSLRKIEIKESNLMSIDKSAFDSLTNLQEIYITETNLEEITFDFSKLTKLTSLIVPKNKITALHESVNNASGLKELNLSYNSLANLPNTIWSIPNVEIVNLENNNLLELPECGSINTKLVNLQLGHNQLQKLPSSFHKITNLVWLELQNNKLVDLPDSMKKMPLSYLNISDNSFKTFPKVVTELPELEYLDMRNLKLGKIPKEMLDKKIQKIDLSGNYISESEIQELKNRNPNAIIVND